MMEDGGCNNLINKSQMIHLVVLCVFDFLATNQDQVLIEAYPQPPHPAPSSLWSDHMPPPSSPPVFQSPPIHFMSSSHSCHFSFPLILHFSTGGFSSPSSQLPSLSPLLLLYLETFSLFCLRTVLPLLLPFLHYFHFLLHSFLALPSILSLYSFPY